MAEYRSGWSNPDAGEHNPDPGTDKSLRKLVISGLSLVALLTTCSAATGELSLVLKAKGIRAPLLNDTGPYITQNPDLRVGAETKQTLREATVVLTERLSIDPLRIGRICTGTKVVDDTRKNGKTYVLTAGHCFKEPGEPKVAVPDGNPPRNIIDTVKKAYVVADPDYPGQKADNLLALSDVTGIAVSNSSDLALLEVDQSLSFTALPALPLSKYTSAEQPSFEPGEGLAISAYPDKATQLINEQAVFLGRSHFEGKSVQYPGMYDVVGLTVTSSAQSPCDRGGSGSQAMSESGDTTGPLTIGTYIPNAGAAQKLGEKLPGIDGTITRYNAICAYNVPLLQSDISHYESVLNR
jgi:hypothetical protein